VYAACQRVLAPGGILAVVTASRAPGGQPADLAGHAVAAARAAGLVYAQHIVLVHAAIDGDHLAPDPATTNPASRASGHHIHSDLLVFTKPGFPGSSPELKGARREHEGAAQRFSRDYPRVEGELGAAA